MQHRLRPADLFPFADDDLPVRTARPGAGEAVLERHVPHEILVNEYPEPAPHTQIDVGNDLHAIASRSHALE